MRWTLKTANSAKPHVLVCCPERHILRLIEVNLERQGWQVRCTTTGQEAIDQLKQELPSILVLDSEVSNPSYREVIRELRMQPMSELVKVILLRSSSDNDEEDENDSGSVQVMKKPFKPMELLKWS